MYDLNEILIRSVECKASDIHLSVGRAPNYRIDGVLHTGGEEKLMPDEYKKECRIFAKVDSTVTLYGVTANKETWTSVSLKPRQLFDLD